MAGPSFQALPGFRDFIPRECAIRNYLFETWRAVARRSGFMEYETPVLEDTALYLKKSGGELSSQLFRFEDQGGRDVTLRPEVTASLARLAAEHQRHFPKPLKWFEIGQCFRYEKPQKGRGREFHQFNVDILGEAGPEADAELIALSIETMLAFGFKRGDFVVRVSDRKAWVDFAKAHGIDDAALPDFLGIIDKFEREKPDVLEQKLSALGLSVGQVKDFIGNPANASSAFNAIRQDLESRGMGEFIELDLSIERGRWWRSLRHAGVDHFQWRSRHARDGFCDGRLCDPQPHRGDSACIDANGSLASTPCRRMRCLCGRRR
jgi:histidyl-tRNA synthetase